MKWVRLSLKARLNLLFGLLLVLGLTLNVARLFFEAGPRVRAEEESGVRLAKDFVQSAVLSIDEASDPGRALSVLVKGLGNFRHIRVTLRSEGAAAPPLPDDDVPSWFVRLVHPAETSIEMPVVVGGRDLGPIVIASNPLDEIGEIWDGIISQVTIGSIVAAALLAVTVFIVDRALAPIADLSKTMAKLAGGDFEARVSPSGSPEVAAICTQLNSLGAALGTAIGEARHLAERVVTLQDDERRDLARELHDEFGPYLFAIRAHAAALVRAVPVMPGSAPVLDMARAIEDQVDALQSSNRRVLARLRPAALDDLGLDAALESLIESWRETHPAVAVSLDNSVDLEDLGEATSLTLYRVVQEGLTNAFRHAGGTSVGIRIEPCRERGIEAVRVRLDDDGIGLPQSFRDGLGLTGMKERLSALGGRLKVGSGRGGGVEIEAVIPVVRILPG